MISVEDALTHVLGLCPPLETESLPLRDALGRRLSQSVAAGLTQPPFDAAAMDGYAIASLPRPGDTYRLVGEAAAGRAFERSLAPGEALRIFTGAPVPQGASHVVIQEDVTRSGTQITIGPTADQSRNIRPRGQDFAQGHRFGPKRIGPADIGLLAAMNVAMVPVHRRPVVAFLSTGDELVALGQLPGPDQIIASSAMALAALAQSQGAKVRILPIARDNLDHLKAALELSEGADLVVTLGGASVGEHDLIGRHAGDLGLTLDFWKIALRPGKPMMAGRRGQTTFLGLPGNPVSAYVCAVLFLLPMLRAFQGDPDPIAKPKMARVTTALATTGPRRHFMRAYHAEDSGEITPQASQDSALTMVLALSNALLIRPEGAGPARAGDQVPFLPLP